MWKIIIVVVIGALIAGAILRAPSIGSMEDDDTMEPNKTIPNTAIPPIDATIPDTIETATFALGWFWGPDSRFGSIDGVIRTRVGYAGGTSRDPTYHNLDGHSETIQIDYDPTRITYQELLEVFWNSHNPTAQPWSVQYMSLVFYHNEEQKNLAIATKKLQEEKLGRPIYTIIKPFSGFYLAEDYHQKYYLRQIQPLLEEFISIYPSTIDFVDSTAAARVNGIAGSYGTALTLPDEVSSYGLSESANELLLSMAERGLMPACPVP